MDNNLRGVHRETGTPARTLTRKGICGARPRGQGGFTLLEILIVMGLMGIFVTLVMPNFNALIPDMKVDKAASKLAADLRLAQQRAVGDMAYVFFYLRVQDPGVPGTENRYYASVFGRDATFEQMEDPLSNSYLDVDYDDDKTFSGIVLQSVQITSGSVNNLWFSPLGSMRIPTDDVTITLRQPSTGYTRQIQVSYPLGKISVLP
jgi:prepilin-type N-terminal cleavage/methylation domain-containing protein